MQPAPQFHGHAEDREKPDEPEERPAPEAAHRSKGERRVRPGNQEKNRGVIDHLQDALETGLRPGVVERGREIKEPHRGNENDRADEERRIFLACGGRAKERRGDQRGGEAQTVADTIGDFLAQGLRPFRRAKQLVDHFHEAVRANIALLIIRRSGREKPKARGCARRPTRSRDA